MPAAAPAVTAARTLLISLWSAIAMIDNPSLAASRTMFLGCRRRVAHVMGGAIGMHMQVRAEEPRAATQARQGLQVHRLSSPPSRPDFPTPFPVCRTVHHQISYYTKYVRAIFALICSCEKPVRRDDLDRRLLAIIAKILSRLRGSSGGRCRRQTYVENLWSPPELAGRVGMKEKEAKSREVRARWSSSPP